MADSIEATPVQVDAAPTGPTQQRIASRLRNLPSAVGGAVEYVKEGGKKFTGKISANISLLREDSKSYWDAALGKGIIVVVDVQNGFCCSTLHLFDELYGKDAKDMDLAEYKTFLEVLRDDPRLQGDDLKAKTLRDTVESELAAKCLRGVEVREDRKEAISKDLSEKLDSFKTDLNVQNAGIDYVKELEGFLAKNKGSNRIVFSGDNHPANHFSFLAQGGPFPPHCIEGTAGARIAAPLRKFLDGTNLFQKGQEVDGKAAFYVEDKSKVDATRSADLSAMGATRGNKTLLNHVLDYGFKQNLIACGLCKDFCVAETVLSAKEFLDKDKAALVKDNETKKGFSILEALGFKAIKNKVKQVVLVDELSLPSGTQKLDLQEKVYLILGPAENETQTPVYITNADNINAPPAQLKADTVKHAKWNVDRAGDTNSLENYKKNSFLTGGTPADAPRTTEVTAQVKRPTANTLYV